MFKLCFESERPASALYVGINPRDVPEALKETYQLYYNWLEHKAGATKQQVRRGDRDDFAATLAQKFEGRILACKSRERFAMIDVDDPDPTTWLERICHAIGEEAIEIIIQTKNGFHVVYQKSKMSSLAHKALGEVLKSDKGTGKEAAVTAMNGPAISCALPGAHQGNHKISIFACSCQYQHPK